MYIDSLIDSNHNKLEPGDHVNFAPLLLSFHLALSMTKTPAHPHESSPASTPSHTFPRVCGTATAPQPCQQAQTVRSGRAHPIKVIPCGQRPGEGSKEFATVRRTKPNHHTACPVDKPIGNIQVAHVAHLKACLSPLSWATKRCAVPGNCARCVWLFIHLGVGGVQQRRLNDCVKSLLVME